MSSSVDGSSSPLLPPNRQPEALDHVPAWRLAGQRGSSRHFTRRTIAMATALATVTVLTGIMTWATTRIGTAPRVALTLIGSDYRNRTDLPVNGCGDRGVGQLAAWVTGSPQGPLRRLELSGLPIRWGGPESLDQIEPNPEADVAVVFVSAHGVGTVDGPAILSADETRSGAAPAVPVTDLIAKFATFPEHQQKLLILDCVHFLSRPSIGILLNDFARQLRGLDDDIRAVPNLVVMVSSDVGQLSWIDPGSGMTRFTTSLVEALNGAAGDHDDDGWVDAREILRQTRRDTSDWVSRICRHQQTPWILPLGETGVERSRRAALYPATSAPVSLPSLLATPRSQRVAQWWDRHDSLKTRNLSPATIAPVLWRRFESLLVRYETYEMTGCRDAADATEMELTSTYRDLTRPTAFDSLSSRSGLVPLGMVGFDVSKGLDTDASELAVLLAEASPADAAARWSEAVAQQPNVESIAALRRGVIMHQAQRLIGLLHDQATVDREKLARAATLVEAVTDPLQPVPQSGLAIRILARDLPDQPLDSQDATRVSRWLQLMLRSDRAAASEPWWDSRAFAWVTPPIERADRARRFAGDLLFGDADARRRVDAHLDEAETALAEVDRIAKILAEAESIRVAGPANLGRIRDLLAARTVPAPHDTARRDAKTVDHLYRVRDQIATRLETTVPTDRGERRRAFEQLAQWTTMYRESMTSLQNRLAEWQQTALTSDTESMAATMAALCRVGGNPADRIAAWERLRRLASTPADPSRSVDDVVSDKEMMAGAAVRGRLALASWPAPLFDSLKADAAEDRAEVIHRLQVFAAESEWWKSLATAGHQIGSRESAAIEILATLPEQHRRDPASQQRPALAASKGDLALRVAALPPAACQDVLTRSSQTDFAKFLVWQRRRFILDAFASLEPDVPPYFVRVAHVLGGDLVEQGLHAQLDADLSSLQDNAILQFEAPEKVTWTTQAFDRFDASLSTDTASLEGFSVLTVESDGFAEATQPVAGQRVCRPIHADQELLVQLRHRGSKNRAAETKSADKDPADPRADGKRPTSGSVTLRGYFRGHRVERQVPIEYREHATASVADSPRPAGGQVAIRSGHADRSAHGGAVTLVLDCSGSMGAARGEDFDDRAKYAAAVQAVTSLLDQLPAGVTLSVWTFGQAIGDAKTARPAERAIRRVQPPTVWDPQDRSLRQNLLDAIRYPILEPWNESPLVAAMFAAAGDLQAHDGLRSLVVITDGADNRIENDPVTNPLGESAEDLIRKKFGGSGITLNVVAFRVESGDQPETRQQLKCVEKLLPPGRFVEADHIDELASALRGMMLVEPVCELRPLGNRPKGDASKSIAIPRSDPSGPAQWTPRLDPGLYRLTHNGNDGPMVRIADGDRLVLATEPSGTTTTWSAIDHEYRWSPHRDLGRWKAALVPLPRSDPGLFARRLVLETGGDSGTLSVQRPDDLWVEATAGDQPLPVRLSRHDGAPGLAYDIEAHGANDRDVTFHVWISDRPTTTTGTLTRGRDFRDLDDLAPASWDLSSGQVRIDSATIETHDVPIADGSVNPQPCLVLRGSCPPGTCYRLRTEGLTAAGQDERSFQDVGQFTFRQWPVTRAEVKRSLSRVELISVEQFRLDAERSGNKATFAPSGSTNHRDANSRKSVSMTRHTGATR